MNCPSCRAPVGAGARQCPACGEEFEAAGAARAFDGSDTVVLPRKDLPGANPASAGKGRRSAARRNPVARFLVSLIAALAVFVLGCFVFFEISMYAGSGTPAARKDAPSLASTVRETLSPGSRPEVVFSAPKTVATVAPAAPPVAPVLPAKEDQPQPAASPEPQGKAKRRAERTRQLELRRDETLRTAQDQQRREEQEAAEAAKKRAEQEESARREAPKPVDPRAAWQQECSEVSVFQRVFCVEKARWRHCEGKWDTTPECATNR